jgi:peptidoglycan LD-endopeptidase LytH
MRAPFRSLRTAWIPVLVALAACGPGGLRDRFAKPASPRDEYVESLRSAGLDRSALGRDWIAAGARALAAPVAAPVPAHERGFFPAGEATAVAYRVAAPTGRRLHVRVEAEADSGTRLFVELFEATGDTASPWRLRLATDSLRTSFGVDVDDSTGYVLRIQPELLRAARFAVRIEGGPSLAFPVGGRDSRAVKSFWGVDRDGGARRHEGIDIFAPRGTPVVAAANGVAWVGENALGGRVVFLRDARRGQSMYYAHLDTQLVRSGAWVEAGDTVGLVGNTGNARTTPPHLHFGIYRGRRRAVNPFPFVDTRRAMVASIGRDSAWVGRLARTAAPARVRVGAGERAAALRDVPAQTVLVVDGAAAGGWLRVRLPDATTGYVPAASVELLQRPVARTTVAAASPLRSRPAPTAPPVQVVERAAEGAVYGRFGEYELVEVDGQRGWLAIGRAGN